jgi:hypothetical protein
MWYVFAMDYTILFVSTSYDHAYEWLEANPPEPGCWQHLKWID